MKTIELIFRKVNKLETVNGVKHFQLEKSIVSSDNSLYYYIDAVYIGIDGKLHFMTSNENGENIKVLSPEEIKSEDLETLYNCVKSL